MTKRPVSIFLFILTLVLITIVSPSRAQNARRDTTPIVPVIPGADHSNPDRVFLEHADRLLSRPGIDYQILVGDVRFRRGGMYMYCDSAHFSEVTGNFDAFGNVRMEQGDTLFIYADQLAYEDSIKLAVLYADDGRNVRLINRDVTLETPVFNYDMGIDLGYYEHVGGKLYDALNTLTSLNGEYNPTSKEAIFTGNVHLTSRNSNNGDTLEIYTTNLYYNTLTHIAQMDDESTVKNADGVIYTSNGEYDTESTYTRLYNRSTVVSMMSSSPGTTLTADTIFYDRKLGRGEAFGNMILTDTVNKMIMEGDYGYFDSMIDSAFVTGRARVIQYRPTGDRDFDPDKVDTLYVNDTFTRSMETIYLHGDTIRAFRNILQRNDTVYYDMPELPVEAVADSLSSAIDSVRPAVADSLGVVSDSIAAALPLRFNVREVSDTIRYVVAAPHVKFYRKDMQGLCDSLTYVSADTMIYMDYSPIVWSENRQISGDVIQIHLKESEAGSQDSGGKSGMALDRATIPTGGFMAEMIEDGYFNQLSGKEMVALFSEGQLRHLDVNGNVLAITFPEENDSTINKVLNIESSFLAADFKDNTIERMKLWSETNATVTPLYLAKKSIFFLPAFKWNAVHRPENPDDIFDFPESLQELFDAARSRGPISDRKLSQPSPVQDAGVMQTDNVSGLLPSVSKPVEDIVDQP
ncbi:MAG: hypothetical protein K2G06_04450 [Muribaculaceae bacterium]|nr:hypothetical protein [Muribaculaceae bacterium]